MKKKCRLKKINGKKLITEKLKTTQSIGIYICKHFLQ